MQVVVDGCDHGTFPVPTVLIRVFGKAGNDTIDLVSLRNLNVPTQLYGGLGNDTVYGTNGVDEIYGGSGDDKLFGGAGDDSLVGGVGDDRLVGEGGNDECLGALGRRLHLWRIRR